jgi:hypothetical protein
MLGEILAGLGKGMGGVGDYYSKLGLMKEQEKSALKQLELKSKLGIQDDIVSFLGKLMGTGKNFDPSILNQIDPTSVETVLQTIRKQRAVPTNTTSRPTRNIFGTPPPTGMSGLDRLRAKVQKK